MGIFKMTNEVINELKAGSLVSTEKVRSNIVNLQKGIVRTNCVDCLDRTNIA